jgi:hypothetical protein
MHKHDARDAGLVRTLSDQHAPVTLASPLAGAMASARRCQAHRPKAAFGNGAQLAAGARLGRPGRGAAESAGGGIAVRYGADDPA